MNGKIMDSIIIRVGQGIMTIPRDPQKFQSAEDNKGNNTKQTSMAGPERPASTNYDTL